MLLFFSFCTGKTCIPEGSHKAPGTCVPFISPRCRSINDFISSSSSFCRFVPGTSDTHRSPKGRARPYPSYSSIDSFHTLLTFEWAAHSCGRPDENKVEGKRGSPIFKAAESRNHHTCLLPRKQDLEFFVDGYYALANVSLLLGFCFLLF